MKKNPDPVGIPMTPEFTALLETRILHAMADVVGDWGRCVSLLTRWEDDHLLDNPTPELLTLHKSCVERLLRLGRLINLSTGDANYPDRSSSEIVSAAIEVLELKLRMWHSPRMSKEQADRIIAQCFGDEARTATIARLP